MKKLIITYFLFVFFPLFSLGQIEVKISNCRDRIFYLQQFKGDRFYKIDSTEIKNGKLKYLIKKNIVPGMYRISDGKNGFVFFVDEPDIDFETQWPAMQDSLKIIKSEENKIYYSYISFRNETNKKLELLSPVLTWYPKNTEFYKTAYHEFDQVQNKLHIWADSIIKHHPKALVSKMIKIDMKPFVPPDLQIEEQKKYFQNHWFDNVDFNDTSLIYSDIFIEKITDFLGLFSDQNMSKAELEQEFSFAVDKILQLTFDNDKMYAFVFNYLVQGFEHYHFDEVLLHIATNYNVPGQCENNDEDSDIYQRLEKYKKMAVGNVVPDIVLPNIEGKIMSLSKINANYKLVLFWSSKCSHCMRLLPKLKKWYKNIDNKNLVIFSVSLDDNKENLEQALTMLNLPWTVVTDFNGWDNAAAIDYNIYATPTMFLLDKNNKILAKPITYNGLKRSVKKNGIK